MNNLDESHVPQSGGELILSNNEQMEISDIDHGYAELFTYRVQEKPLPLQVDDTVKRMHLTMKQDKLNGNEFKFTYRLVKVPHSSTLNLPDISDLREKYQQTIESLYLFKMHLAHEQGYNFGIYLRLKGYCHRKTIDKFVQEFAKAVAGEDVLIKPFVPNIKQRVSIYDYIQSLYQLPHNLVLSFSHKNDMTPGTPTKRRPPPKKNIKDNMLSLTKFELDQMISMPTRYPSSYLLDLLRMTHQVFKRHMRKTNINEVVQRIAQDAYGIALQSPRFKHDDAQELMEPVNMRSLINDCVNHFITKRIQCLFQQTFGEQFVHPHPYNGIAKSDFPSLRVMDGLIFDPRFMFNVLLVSRWFAQSCMLDEDAASNNHAHLLLYGSAGTGKSFIVSSIASAIPTYRYLTTSNFQNPDILQSSLLQLEEFGTLNLPSNQYKSLLDLKTHVKVDFKNLHPENVTQGVPCMITTNDDLFTTLMAQRKYNSASVAAALRRLYIIPMKGCAFDAIHGKMAVDHPFYRDLMHLEGRFEKETNKKERLFNLIIQFALYQQDVKGMHLDPRVHSYFSKMARDFTRTAFGTFYLSQKAKVDEILLEVEQLMKSPDMDDTTYMIRVSQCFGQFQQVYTQFLAQATENNADINTQILKDKQITWPLKAYHLLSSTKFTVRLMWEMDKLGEPNQLLNPEIRSFIEDQTMKLYQTTEEHPPIHPDIASPEDSVAEGKDPCGSSDESIKDQKMAPVMTEEAFAEIESLLSDHPLLKKRSLAEMAELSPLDPALEDAPRKRLRRRLFDSQDNSLGHISEPDNL